MKNRGFLGLVLIAIVFSACFHSVPNNSKPDITRDTLSYTNQVIKQRADDCGNQPDSTCTSAIIKYPLFAGQNLLNDSVGRKLLSLFDARDSSLQVDAKKFIAGYQTQKKASKNLPPFMLKLYAKVIRQDSGLLTLQTDGYSFTGGAHGSSLTLFFNWNTKAQKTIALSDILIDGYQPKLTHVADSIFRKSENLKDTSSLARDYFFKDAKFALNNNFLITPLGIRFLYNEYEIKPYAAGSTDLFIPYTQIKSLLKPNTVIQQYIK